VFFLPEPKTLQQKKNEVEYARQRLHMREQQLEAAWKSLGREERDVADYDAYVARVNKRRKSAIEKIDRLSYAVELRTNMEYQEAKEFCRSTFKRGTWMVTYVYRRNKTDGFEPDGFYHLFMFEHSEHAIIFKFKFG
jgi:hypothetical protein